MRDAERHSRAYYNRRARVYDWFNRVAALLRGVSPGHERRKAVRRLRPNPGDRLLEVSVGTGTNLPLMVEQASPTVRLVGIDISRGMLNVCTQKLARHRLIADLVEADAAHLPLLDESFDAVLHHGGLAEFSDRKAAIDEMWRVAKQGGRVVICDVGVPDNARLSLVNRLLLRLQPQYNQHPPMDLLPSDAQDVRLSWYFGGAWYMIELVKPAS